MARPTANLRLFVAVYPPPAVAQALCERIAAIDEIAGLPPFRMVSVDRVHLTVHFIGDRPTKDMEDVVESARRAAGGIEPFELAPLKLITLPQQSPAKPTRLVAVETDSPPGLLELQRRLALRFARKPRPKTGDRFLPHMTLCRLRTPSRLPESAIEAVSAPIPTIPPFAVTSLSLMRSRLHHTGAEHIEVERVGLTPTSID